MSDKKLRKLERWLHETCSAEDEAAYLLERVRTGGQISWAYFLRLSSVLPETAEFLLRKKVERGEIGLRSLELAAYCGNEIAASALNQAPPAQPPVEHPGWDPDGFCSFLRGFSRWGHPAMVRSTLAVVRPVLKQPTRPVELARVIDAVEDWLRCPCEAHADRCKATELVSSDPVRMAVFYAGAAVRAPDCSGAQFVDGPLLAMEATGVSTEHARKLIGAEVVPWALGIHDPATSSSATGRTPAPRTRSCERSSNRRSPATGCKERS